MSIGRYVEMLERANGAFDPKREIEPNETYALHQTLVIIYPARPRPPDGLSERITRFVTSLNSAETIKADVMSVLDSGILYFGFRYSELGDDSEFDYGDTQLKLKPIADQYTLVIEVNR